MQSDVLYVFVSNFVSIYVCTLVHVCVVVEYIGIGALRCVWNHYLLTAAG